LRYGRSVTASIGGLEVRVMFAGPAAGFAGLDQVNVPLPFALRGRGELDVTLRMERLVANTVRIHMR
jgi:uncharacterized protein (TIGR03437 family)